MKTLLLLSALTLAAQAQTPAVDPFAPVRFLAGEWVGEGSGAPGKGQGAFSFRFELEGRALVRRSAADYPARDGRPAVHHEDLLTVFAEGGRLRALYLDNEGHVIRYAVQPLDRGVVFQSEPAPGPAFRLTYTSRGEGAATVAFAIAPPDKPGAFSTYEEGDCRRTAK